MQEYGHITPQQRLIIRISRNSLVFASINNESGGAISFYPYVLKSGISMAANLREAFRTEDILRESYSRILIMIDSPTLMVPLEEFREDAQQVLYQHAYQDHEKDEIVNTVLPDLNCVAREKLYAYFHDRHMEIFSYGQNRFKFCNSFDVRDPHDALYYLLYTWKQIGLQAERDEIHMVGSIPEGDWLAEELKKYIKRVYTINPAGDFNRATVTQIEGMPYDLMTLFVKGR